jgi:hypothetical protein
LREVPEAYDFLPGEETVEGHAWVIDAVPRSDFQAKTKNGKYLTKFRGRRIGTEDYQWVKAMSR